mmetsp:Transcript_34793/g.108405  ORF Transcript_34793/g.108405 Transcript_34793/m.108405 type:complete len:203 (+) Transcript_34793:2-610(+)
MTRPEARDARARARKHDRRTLGPFRAAALPDSYVRCRSSLWTAGQPFSIMQSRSTSSRSLSPRRCGRRASTRGNNSRASSSCCRGDGSSASGSSPFRVPEPPVETGARPAAPAAGSGPARDRGSGGLVGAGGTTLAASGSAGRMGRGAPMSGPLLPEPSVGSGSCPAAPASGSGPARNRGSARLVGAGGMTLAASGSTGRGG